MALIHQDEIGAWLRLLETPKVGRDSARKLLLAFGSPEAVLAASVAARSEVVGTVAAAALGERAPEPLIALIEATIAWLRSAESAAPRHLIALGDPDYPSLLLQMADPPLLLYTQGALACLSRSAIAVVGSRNPTAQGVENAKSFATALSAAGLAVVSGLALGIDGAAHEGGLSGPGKTIAVVGTGLDRVYPKRHLTLAHRIAQEGLLISEFSIGTPPMPAHFPLRNRIIAGLAQGTLVVEAALQSGSLITARLASECGREVFAIPGSIHAPQARGCHALIKQGAKLVDDARDVLEELAPQWVQSALDAHPNAPIDEQPLADLVLEAMAFDPVSLDVLVLRTSLEAQELSVHLLSLEMDGRVARLPGQLFQRLGQ